MNVYFLIALFAGLSGFFYSKWRSAKKQNATLSSANVEWSNSLIQTQKEKESYKLNFEMVNKLVIDLNDKLKAHNEERETIKQEAWGTLEDLAKREEMYEKCEAMFHREYQRVKRDNEMLFEHNLILRDKVKEKIFQLRVLKGVNDKMITDAFFKPLFERRYQNQIQKQKKALQKIELIARDGFWDDKSIDKDCNRIIKIAQEAQGIVVVHKGGAHPAPKNVTVQVAKKKPVLKKKRITKKQNLCH